MDRCAALQTGWCGGFGVALTEQARTAAAVVVDDIAALVTKASWGIYPTESGGLTFETSCLDAGASFVESIEVLGDGRVEMHLLVIHAPTDAESERCTTAEFVVDSPVGVVTRSAKVRADLLAVAPQGASDEGLARG